MLVNCYVITNVGNTGEWVVSQNDGFVGQYTSLASALAYLATVLVYGDSIVYQNEPLTTARI